VIRLPDRLLLLAACAMLAAVAGVLSPAGAGAAQVLVLDDPITDNYKASYNADPTAPELRTWLAVASVTVDGTTWRPQAPGSISVTSGGAIELLAGDGRRGTLTATVASGPLTAPLQRADPLDSASRGRWGPLTSVTDRATLRTTPGVVRLRLVVAGAEIGVGTVSYVHDPALAGAPAGSIEHNGPGGRWYVGATRTRTQEEAAPAVAPSIAADGVPGAAPAGRPRIVRVRMPVRSSSRLVPLRVSGRSAGGIRITHLRVRIDAQRWSGWVRTRSSYTLRLPRGTRTRAVRIQVRDASGRTSAVALRRIRCTCR
jgi:hypothetical protein